MTLSNWTCPPFEDDTDRLTPVLFRISANIQRILNDDMMGPECTACSKGMSICVIGDGELFGWWQTRSENIAVMLADDGGDGDNSQWILLLWVDREATASPVLRYRLAVCDHQGEILRLEDHIPQRAFLPAWHRLVQPVEPDPTCGQCPLHQDEDCVVASGSAEVSSLSDVVQAKEQQRNILESPRSPRSPPGTSTSNPLHSSTWTATDPLHYAPSLATATEPGINPSTDTCCTSDICYTTPNLKPPPSLPLDAQFCLCLDLRWNEPVETYSNLSLSTVLSHMEEVSKPSSEEVVEDVEASSNSFGSNKKDANSHYHHHIHQLEINIDSLCASSSEVQALMLKPQMEGHLRVPEKKGYRMASATSEDILGGEEPSTGDELGEEFGSPQVMAEEKFVFDEFVLKPAATKPTIVTATVLTEGGHTETKPHSVVVATKISSPRRPVLEGQHHYQETPLTVESGSLLEDLEYEWETSEENGEECSSKSYSTNPSCSASSHAKEEASEEDKEEEEEKNEATTLKRQSSPEYPKESSHQQECTARDNDFEEFKNCVEWPDRSFSASVDAIDAKVTTCPTSFITERPILPLVFEVCASAALLASNNDEAPVVNPHPVEPTNEDESLQQSAHFLDSSEAPAVVVMEQIPAELEQFNEILPEVVTEEALQPSAGDSAFFEDHSRVPPSDTFHSMAEKSLFSEETTYSENGTLITTPPNASVDTFPSSVLITSPSNNEILAENSSPPPLSDCQTVPDSEVKPSKHSSVEYRRQPMQKFYSLRGPPPSRHRRLSSADFHNVMKPSFQLELNVALRVMDDALKAAMMTHKMTVNDDAKFPDSVTPTKVERGLNGEGYDVPFIDDEAFYYKDWYVMEDHCWSRLDTLPASGVVGNIGGVPAVGTAARPSTDTTVSADGTNRSVIVSPTQTKKSKRGFFHFCSCMRRHRR